MNQNWICVLTGSTPPSLAPGGGGGGDFREPFALQWRRAIAMMPKFVKEISNFGAFSMV
jgi:hypothetical protein